MGVENARRSWQKELAARNDDPTTKQAQVEALAVALRELDLDSLPPIEALLRLRELRDMLDQE